MVGTYHPLTGLNSIESANGWSGHRLNPLTRQRRPDPLAVFGGGLGWRVVNFYQFGRLAIWAEAAGIVGQATTGRRKDRRPGKRLVFVCVVWHRTCKEWYDRTTLCDRQFEVNLPGGRVSHNNQLGRL